MLLNNLRTINLFIILSLSLFIDSCQDVIPSNTIEKSFVEKQNTSKIYIKGKVNLNDFYSSKFEVKALEQEISSKATVSLLYPSDYSDTSLRNTAILAGVTDSQGNFNISAGSFSPVINQTLVLEASKRIGGVGNPSISLRTLLKWNGSGWDSITKPDIYINKKTTAVSIYSHYKPEILSSSDAIGRISVVNNNSSILYDSKLTSDNLNRLLSAIDIVLYGNRDPLENIYSSTEFYFGDSDIRSMLSALKANMNIVQSSLETYAVDWGGIYPSNTSELIQEAKSKNYWKTITNSLTGDKDDSVIDYSDYINAKNNLIYKGNPIESISELKGKVVVSTEMQGGDITRYYIYGVDLFGEFLTNNYVYPNSNSPTQIFYLTNN
jgi:hypothetical protein